MNQKRRKNNFTNIRILLILILVIFSVQSKAQFVFKSKSSTITFDNVDLKLLIEASKAMDEFKGFNKLLEDSCLGSITKRKIKNLEIVDIKLCKEKGNIYSNHIYLFKQLGVNNFFYTNCDTLIYSSCQKTSDFLIALTIKDKLISQRFKILNGNLRLQKDIVLFKNDDCRSVDLSNGIIYKNDCKNLRKAKFNVLNECDNKTENISIKIP